MTKKERDELIAQIAAKKNITIQAVVGEPVEGMRVPGESIFTVVDNKAVVAIAGNNAIVLPKERVGSQEFNRVSSQVVKRDGTSTTAASPSTKVGGFGINPMMKEQENALTGKKQSSSESSCRSKNKTQI